MSFTSNFRAEEKAVFALRGIYEGYGYNKYKVSQFEEYSFYLKYKSFLQSDKFLSFTDLDGRLMALKPDITLSIIKNTSSSDSPQKLYYNETVYRESQSTNTFREINQMGLEYIGEVTPYAVCEVVLLAKRSLCEISESNVLELSHMGYVEGLFDAIKVSGDDKETLLGFISQKSVHEISSFCALKGFDETCSKSLCELCLISGRIDEALIKAHSLCKNEKMNNAIKELSLVNEALTAAGEANIRLDFTLLNDNEYYDGILFSGYISGVPQAVLSGGRYNGMMQKLAKTSGAIGFAVYLSLLEYIREENNNIPDVTLLTNGESPSKILACVEELSKQGKRVLVSENGIFADAKEIYKLEKGGLVKC